MPISKPLHFSVVCINRGQLDGHSQDAGVPQTGRCLLLWKHRGKYTVNEEGQSFTDQYEWKLRI